MTATGKVVHDHPTSPLLLYDSKYETIDLLHAGIGPKSFSRTKQVGQLHRRTRLLPTRDAQLHAETIDCPLGKMRMRMRIVLQSDRIGPGKTIDIVPVDIDRIIKTIMAIVRVIIAMKSVVVVIEIMTSTAARVGPIVVVVRRISTTPGGRTAPIVTATRLIVDNDPSTMTGPGLSRLAVPMR